MAAARYCCAVASAMIDRAMSAGAMIAASAHHAAGVPSSFTSHDWLNPRVW